MIELKWYQQFLFSNEHPRNFTESKWRGIFAEILLGEPSICSKTYVIYVSNDKYRWFSAEKLKKIIFIELKLAQRINQLQ